MLIGKNRLAKMIVKYYNFIHASVAQLDRALPSGGKGRWFESHRVHVDNI